MDLRHFGRYGEGDAAAEEPGNAGGCHAHRSAMNASPFRLPSVLISALVLLTLAACGDSAQKQAAAPPTPTVTVVKPVTRNIIDQDEYVGRFVAVESVEVRARVSGYLEKVLFNDGQLVKVGDPLFTIDGRPFRNTLAQVQANLAQARANLAFTTSDLDRANQLFKEKTISEQVFEQRGQAKRIAEAAVAAQEALVRQASLDVEFTELKATVAGRIGDRRVSQGNLVTGGTTGNTTLLATIVSIDPIRFEFTFDEASLLRYERFASAKGNTDRGVSTEIKLKLIDEPNFTHNGRMDFVDNSVDRATGTIRARAEVANRTGLFVPGMFARVQVPGSPAYDALMVPDVAIASEQTRRYVLAIDAENIVRQKYVVPGQVLDGLRVIKQGLNPDDRVVVSGQMQARPGQKVNVQEAPAARPASAAGPSTTKPN